VCILLGSDAKTPNKAHSFNTRHPAPRNPLSLDSTIFSPAFISLFLVATGKVGKCRAAFAVKFKRVSVCRLNVCRILLVKERRVLAQMEGFDMGRWVVHEQPKGHQFITVY